jgi:hypothetical protein
MVNFPLMAGAGSEMDRSRSLPTHRYYGELPILLVPVERIELPTFGLQNRCSTAELNRHSLSECLWRSPAPRQLSPGIGRPARRCRSLAFVSNPAAQVRFKSKVKMRVRLRLNHQAVWLLNVLVLSQRRQTHAPQGHAGGADVLRGLYRRQLFCARAAREPLRPAKGGQAGPHRGFASAGELGDVCQSHRDATSRAVSEYS